MVPPGLSARGAGPHGLYGQCAMGLIRKSLAVSTLGVVHGSSKKQRVAKATLNALTPAQSPQSRVRRLNPGESLTPGGFLRRADGVVVIPAESKRLYDSWCAAGSIASLTMAEIVGRVGFNCDPVPAVRFSNGYAHTWSRPGYTIGVLFGHDNKAIGILDGSQRLG